MSSSMSTREGPCILFDLDGTLCDTVEVDDECYRLAMAPALQVRSEDVDWANAPHRTDSGIARWLWSAHHGSEPTADDIAGIRRRFFDLLEVRRNEAPHRFACIKGAPGFIRACLEAGFRVGIGTGGWRPSAALKLEAAGFPIESLHATADEGETRIEIFSRAHAMAGGSPVLLVGDSECDARTAVELGWTFVGIGAGEHAERLVRLGAILVVDNYLGKDARSWVDACVARR